MTKQITYLSITALVLLVIYILMQSTSVPVQKVEYIAAIDTAKISSITINKDVSTVNLERKPGGWVVTNPIEYKANASFVRTLLEKMDGMRIESKITEKQSRWAEFEVDAGQATNVIVKQEGATYEFVLGKAAEGYKQTYARRKDDDTVYLIKGTYGASMNRTADNWRDKKVSDFEKEQVIGIVYEDMSLQLEGDVWKLKEKRGGSIDADRTKVDRVTGAFARLRTSNFPTEDEYAGVAWNKPVMKATVELASGGNREYTFYNTDQENQYFMKYSGSDVVYKVFKGITNQLFKEKADLLPDEEEKDKE